MSNVTNQISKVLNNDVVKNGLNIEAIKTANEIGTRTAKSSVSSTFETARLLTASVEFFKSKVCKQVFRSHELDWTIEQYLKHIGFPSKAWAYTLMKAVKLEFKTIQTIKGTKATETKVNMLDKYLSSEQTNYSIELFVKWAEDKPKDDKKKETFKLKLIFNDVKLSINSKDELDTTLSASEIKSIMVLLQRKIDAMAKK
jgi:hypothetical protein